jgi:hypothetical protein
MQQFTTRYFGCSQRNCLLTVHLGQVVMISMKSSFRNVQACRESVQFIKTRITDHVTPMAFFVPPAALINKNCHGFNAGGVCEPSPESA